MTVKQLEGTYAVVTGASSGLGFSMAEALLQEGAALPFHQDLAANWMML